MHANIPLSWMANGIALLAIVCILWNLGAALFALLCDRGSSDKLLSALLRRMVISVFLFAALLGAAAMGWIMPKVLWIH